VENGTRNCLSETGPRKSSKRCDYPDWSGSETKNDQPGGPTKGEKSQHGGKQISPVLPFCLKEKNRWRRNRRLFIKQNVKGEYTETRGQKRRRKMENAALLPLSVPFKKEGRGG